MELETITDAESWDAALRSLPRPHILQSRPWGEVKSRWGWEPHRLLWRDEAGTPLAAAQLLVRRGFPRLGYVPRGPLFARYPSGVEDEVLADLERLARHHRLLLVKIDPEVAVGTPEAERLRAAMERRGWHPSPEQIQFRNTMRLDLRPDPDSLLRAMKPKWRYNIRLARRRGVEVRVAEPGDFPRLYALYAETAARDHFIIRSEAYYLDLWRTFVEAGYATPLVAAVEGEWVAMLFLFHFGTWAWYLYGASSNRHRNRMPNHLLQWEAILRAKAMGCTTYDLWGAPDRLEPSDPMWGVYRFKAGFGATFVEQIGAWDFAPAPWLLRGYDRLRPAFVALMHRLHRLRQGAG